MAEPHAAVVAIPVVELPQKSVAAPQPTPPPPKQDGSKWAARWEVTKEFIIKHFLPLSFLVAIVFALAYPVPGEFLVHITVMDNIHIIQEINIFIVFFISGLVLNTSEIKKALTRNNVIGIAYGFFAILFLTGCLGFVMREIPLQPQDFSIGLTIFSVVPTTLGIGVALTRSCKGNEAIALFLTVGTNMLGVVVIPIMLKFLFINYDTNGLDITVDVLNLFIRLTITTLAPSVIGKALRDLWKPAELFATKYRVPLSLFSTANLAFIVWQTLSGARDRLFEQSAGMVFAVIGLAIGQHIFYLLCNWVVVWFGLKMPLKEAISVIVMASQKSAPVAVTVISYITPDPAIMGLLSIPCIVGQISQIFIGSALAAYVAPLVDRTYPKPSPPISKAPSQSASAGGGGPKTDGTTNGATDGGGGEARAQPQDGGAGELVAGPGPGPGGAPSATAAPPPPAGADAVVI